MIQCVYMISCVDNAVEEFYIGSTDDLYKRICHHKGDYISFPNRKVYQFIRDNGGMSNWEIIPIEIFTFLTNEELRQYEQWYLDEYKPDLNCNKAYTTEEQRRDYVKKFKKKYREKNREKINAKQNEKIKCPHCNEIMCRQSISRHIKRKHTTIST